MSGPARICAIVTGSVAFACATVSASWWFAPGFGEFSAFAVAFIAFMTGFLGFFLMFGLVYERLQDRDGELRRADVAALVWKRTPELLKIWLAVAVAAAVLGAVVGAAKAGQWESGAPYSYRNCHWPLYTNHDTEHMCVGHDRWLTVKFSTDRIFLAFGVGFLAVDCLVLTALSRSPRPARRRIRRSVRT